MIAVHVPQDEAGVAAQQRALTPRERAVLSPRAVSKRRREFGAGRAAAHHAVATLWHRQGRAPQPFSILPQASGEQLGRPMVVLESGDGARATDVSITHAQPFAMATAAETAVGFDLVNVEPFAAAFRREAFAVGELEGWAASLATYPEDDLVSSTAFAAKEAVLKLWGTGLRMPLLAVRVVPDGVVVAADVEGIAGAAAPWRVSVRGQGCCLLGGWTAYRQGQVLALAWDPRRR